VATNHYKFTLLEEEDGLVSYAFITINSAVYTVYFNIKEYDKHLDKYPHLFNKGVGFGFFLNVKPNKFGLDPLVSATIEAILHEFIETNGVETVLLFHCDYSDARQACRDKLFTTWYNQSDSRHEFKRDRFEATIQETGVMHFMGYLTPILNPNIEKVQLEFDACAFNLMQDKITE
jgi:hypothetical protein